MLAVVEERLMDQQVLLVELVVVVVVVVELVVVLLDTPHLLAQQTLVAVVGVPGMHMDQQVVLVS
jgi:hypothetical protein